MRSWPAVYVLAQDINTAQPDMTPEQQAQIIGGMLLTHQVTIDFHGGVALEDNEFFVPRTWRYLMPADGTMSSELDRQFRALNAEFVHLFETEVNQRRARATAREAHRLDYDVLVERMSIVGSFDAERVRMHQQVEETALSTFLDAERPAIQSRSPAHGALDAKRIAVASGLAIPGRVAMSPFAASLMSGSAANIEGNPGERGNPWILPFFPGRMDVRQSVSGGGYGLCGYARPWVDTTTRVILWFLFFPRETRNWHLAAVVNLHGYLLLRASREWWNCKYAHAKITARVGVHQYYWQGWQESVLLEQREEHVDEAQPYDGAFGGGEFFDTDAFLRAEITTPTWIAVVIDL